MIEEHHWLAYDTTEQPNRSIDALTALLKIAKTAQLESSELWICKCNSLVVDRKVQEAEKRTIGGKE